MFHYHPTWHHSRSMIHHYHPMAYHHHVASHWLAHTIISSIIHGLIYGAIFHLFRGMPLAEVLGITVVGIMVIGLGYMWWSRR
jgi:hypothetical protein